MKKPSILTNIFILLFILTSFSTSFSDYQKVNWTYLHDTFGDIDLENLKIEIDGYEPVDWVNLSKSIIEKMAAEDFETQRLAMRNIILYNHLYGDHLDVDDTVFDLLNIYNTNENPKVRQLAVVTLHSIGNEWAMKNLCESLPYEQDSNLKRFMTYCLYDYHCSR
jgi:hypothetical protein